MKKRIIVMGSILLAFLTFSASAQAPMVPIEEGGKMPGQPLDTSDVPKEVTNIYIIEYPVVTSPQWYGYSDFSEGEWYNHDPAYYTDKGANPDYYVVLFNKDDTPHKAVYSKTGKKLATHRKIKQSSDFPPAVLNAFKKSAYKNWQIKGDNHEITKESDKKKVYKIAVENGTEKHVLYYDATGKLLKDKKVAS